jgi:hypothetical protein
MVKLKWADNPNRHERRRRLRMLRMSPRVRKEKETDIKCKGAFGSYGGVKHPHSFLFHPRQVASVPTYTQKELDYGEYLNK